MIVAWTARDNTASWINRQPQSAYKLHQTVCVGGNYILREGIITEIRSGSDLYQVTGTIKYGPRRGEHVEWTIRAHNLAHPHEYEAWRASMSSKPKVLSEIST